MFKKGDKVITKWNDKDHKLGIYNTYEVLLTKPAYQKMGGQLLCTTLDSSRFLHQSHFIKIGTKLELIIYGATSISLVMLSVKCYP